MTEQRKPIGSAFPWIIARVVIPLMTAVALLSPLYESPLEDLAIFLAFLAYLAIMSDSLILEEADKEGIYYRRYFRKQFVPWNQTLGVIWTGWPKRQIIRVLLDTESRWRNRLEFSSTESYSWIPAFKPSTPDIVPWIAQQIDATADRISYPHAEHIFEQKPLGSFRLRMMVWFPTVGVPLLLAGWIEWTFRPWEFNSSAPYGIISILFILVIFLPSILKGIAETYGYASYEGIGYRRYFTWRFAPWEEIEKVIWEPWRPADLIIRLPRPWFRRTLRFTLMHSARKMFFEYRGRPMPEIVSLIRRHIRAANSKPLGLET